MHYKNGREAKPGDVVVCVDPHNHAMGILHSVNAGSTTCNGRIAKISTSDPYVTIGQCLHIDDVKAAEVPDSSKPA